MVGMTKRRTMIQAACILAAALTATSCADVGIKTIAQDMALNNAPVPGASGALTVDTVTSTGFTVYWTAATDDSTAVADLEYKVVTASLNTISTPSTAEDNGLVAMGWTKNKTAWPISGLSAGNRYYVTVLVRDSLGDKAVYAAKEGPGKMSLVKKSGSGSINTTVSPITYSFTAVSSPLTATLTIGNQGFGTLRLTNAAPNFIAISGTDASYFSITSQPPSDAIDPGNTSDFILRIATLPDYTTRYGTASIPNNNPDTTIAGSGFYFSLIGSLC